MHSRALQQHREYIVVIKLQIDKTQTFIVDIFRDIAKGTSTQVQQSAFHLLAMVFKLQQQHFLPASGRKQIITIVRLANAVATTYKFSIITFGLFGARTIRLLLLLLRHIAKLTANQTGLQFKVLTNAIIWFLE